MTHFGNIHALCYIDWVIYVNDGTHVKQIYIELTCLYGKGLNTCMTCDTTMYKVTDEFQMKMI